MAIVAPTTPTPAPTPPDRADRATFSARATASFDHLKNYAIPELAGLATNAYNNATETFTLSAAAQAAATAAAGYAATATNAPGTKATSTTPHSVSLGSKTFAIQTGKSIAVGQTMVAARTSDPVNTRLYGVVSAENSVTGSVTLEVVGTTGSGGPYSDWTISLGVNVVPTVGAQDITITTRGTVSMLVVGDKGKFFDLTGGITQTLDTAANLGAGWWCEIGSGDNTTITVDASGSELIDGALTLAVLPGYRYRLISTGTAFKTRITKRRKAPALADLVLVTANTDYIVPADTFVFRSYAVGQGAAGGSNARGAAGGMAYGDIAVQPGDTVQFRIASGVATVTVNGVVMLTANAASGATGGTASKHASVTNGGAYSGGAGTASGTGGGASSGSPLGAGIASVNANGGCGWGGTGDAVGGYGGGGGTGGNAVYTHGGPSISRALASNEPLLALLNGSGGVGNNGTPDVPGAAGGPGAGGGGNTGGSQAGGAGGIGGGGGATSGTTGGAGGFGGGGGRASGGAGTGGAGGYGGGGGSGGTSGGAAGAAAFLYFKPE